MPKVSRRISRRSFLGAGGALLAADAAAQAGNPASLPQAPAVTPAGVPSAWADGVHTGGARTVRVHQKYDVWAKQVGSGEVPVLTNAATS